MTATERREPSRPALRLTVMLVRVALCVPLFLLSGCRGSDDAVYPPESEPATAQQVRAAVASPGQGVRPVPARTSCVAADVLTVDRNPLLMCLGLGESSTVVLPEVPGGWRPARTNNSGVAAVKRQGKLKNGISRFEVLAAGVGIANITVENPGTGEAPGRVATVTVTVSG